MRNFLWTTFLGGVVVVLPLTVFILLANLIFKFIRGIIEPISKLIPPAWINNDLLADFLTLVVIVFFFFFVGLAIKTRLGRAIVQYIDRELLHRLPTYPTIKETVQQFLGTKKTPFSQVVLADIYGNDTRMVGFIADEHEDGTLSLFVPTGPNPTTGYIFLVKEHQIQRINARPDEVIRMIIGVGVGSSKVL